MLITASIIGLAGILMVVGVVRQLILVVKNRHNLNLGYFLPITIYLIFLFLPTGSVEDYLSPIKFRASHEGTNAQSVIYFRNDHTFQMHSTMAFFSEWSIGKWQQKKDTLLLNWDGRVHPKLGRTLLVDSGYLKPLDALVAKELRIRPLFYLDCCKGQN
ncbi:hypothetical protein EPL05_14015 [Mucilaginibacter gilvus]|uniref:Uncharacterized protein n=2 Tax=Mucilaginibacter gilvus TaxID=2305909 RepID=A0A444MNA5_9SPHI|nr:hypothetical protein EPL05_14015 [Mucilaginibacter gilvus]